jgi:hypothetical protein
VLHFQPDDGEEEEEESDEEGFEGEVEDEDDWAHSGLLGHSSISTLTYRGCTH